MRKRTENRTAFTLVEIMAVIIIIGLLAAVAAKNFMGKVEKAKVQTTKANLKVLHESVLMFKLDTGYYPSEEAGLEDLVIEPTDVEGWDPAGYLESTEIPLDAWKNEFLYLRNPESGKPFVIISFGADGEEGGGEEGGEANDADLYSTDAF